MTNEQHAELARIESNCRECVTTYTKDVLWVLEQLKAAQEGITALKSDDGLTTAYMCGFHKRDDEVRLLKEENERLKAGLEQFADCDLHEGNCASLEIASKRIKNIAKQAISTAPTTINDIHNSHLAVLAKDTHIICGPNGMCLCGVYDGKSFLCGHILSIHSEDFRKALTFETILPGGKIPTRVTTTLEVVKG